MKKSRLNLFKVTSMSISVLGILMIVATIAIFAYIGISSLSSTISSDVDSGSAYDKIASLNSDYSTLSGQYDKTKTQVDSSGNANITAEYNDANLQLVKAKNAINDAQSAVSAGKSSDEINSRISTAESQLQTAKESLSKVNAMF
ncbi:hypothetical protein [Methanobacterium congolense]|nr:hypothetical protein [Methanobacterium congolense]